MWTADDGGKLREELEKLRLRLRKKCFEVLNTCTYINKIIFNRVSRTYVYKDTYFSNRVINIVVVVVVVVSSRIHSYAVVSVVEILMKSCYNV